MSKSKISEKDLLLTLYRLDQIEKRLDMLESNNQTKEILGMLLPILDKKQIVEPIVEDKQKVDKKEEINKEYDDLLSFARRRTII